MADTAGIDGWAEHLAWCKTRALEYIEMGDVGGAVASMISDFAKSELGIRMDPMMAFDGMQMAAQGDVDGARRWIEGFN